MKSINCRGELLSFDTPKVMGILNVTPDSFFVQSRVQGTEILAKAEQMLALGATFVDIGGYSSRPNAAEVSAEEELQRVVPVVEVLVKHYPAEVARQSLEAGACMINDISAGQIDPAIWDVVAHYQVPYIAMHMRGTPQTKQSYTEYQNLTTDILYYFSEIKDKARQLKINDLIVDPGFGFSKTLPQNYQLMQHLAIFDILDCPILVGISRKSMIYKLLETSAEEALNGTTVLNTFALLHGADILRVHDVKEAMECVRMVEALNGK